MTDDVDKIPDDLPITSLNVGQFKELITHEKRIKYLKELESSFKHKLEEVKALGDHSKEIFKDSENLQAASTPFRLRTKEDVEKLVKSLMVCVDLGQPVLMIMATETPDGLKK